MVVRLKSTRGGIQLMAGSSAAAGDGVGDALLEIALSEPGDTSAEIQKGTLVVQRFIPGATAEELRRATYGLAKAALACDDVLRARGEFASNASAVAIPDEPAFSSAAPIAAALQAMMPQVMVPGPQPAWDAPNPATSPRVQLQPGVAYTLLGRQGDWAKVATSGDVVVFTDGRTLKERQ